MRTITTLLIAITFVSCQVETIESQTAQAYSLIKKYQPETNLTPEMVREAIERGGTDPCLYDYNVDGKINTADLVTLLEDDPTGDIITQFLVVYGDEYIVDVIPAHNNFIQDFNCNLGWDVVVRRQCAGNVTNFPTFDSLEWVHDGEVISTNRIKLDFQNYDSEGNPLDECSGWQPPCNGINRVGMRVYCNGFSFYRESDGWVRTNNFPKVVPVCGNASSADFLFGSDFLPLEFLEEW